MSPQVSQTHTKGPSELQAGRRRGREREFLRQGDGGWKPTPGEPQDTSAGVPTEGGAAPRGSPRHSGVRAGEEGELGRVWLPGRPGGTQEGKEEPRGDLESRSGPELWGRSEGRRGQYILHRQLSAAAAKLPSGHLPRCVDPGLPAPTPAPCSRPGRTGAHSVLTARPLGGLPPPPGAASTAGPGSTPSPDARTARSPPPTPGWALSSPHRPVLGRERSPSPAWTPRPWEAASQSSDWVPLARIFLLIHIPTILQFVFQAVSLFLRLPHLSILVSPPAFYFPLLPLSVCPCVNSTLWASRLPLDSLFLPHPHPTRPVQKVAPAPGIRPAPDGTSRGRAESVPKHAPLFASARAAPAHATSVARAPGSHPAHPRSSPGAVTPHAPAAASLRGRRASFPGCRRTAGLGQDSARAERSTSVGSWHPGPLAFSASTFTFQP